jgi:hypothetical protein
MSQEFLKHGDAVLICGRSLKSVQAAVQALQREAPRSQVAYPTSASTVCILLPISP